jgi:hypothetical protein
MSMARGANMWMAGVAAGVCLVLIVTIAALSGRSETDTFLKRPSTFFTDPSGTRGIFLVLQRVMPSVKQWRLPLTELQGAAPHSSLIVMGPTTMGQAEAKSLDGWISSGGQLILAANVDWPVQGAKNGPPNSFLQAHGVSPVKDGRPAIQAAVFKEVGRGRIIYLPDAYAFSNSNLGKTDNAVWLAERCGEWGGGVLFDEYHLGFNEQRGLISLVGAFLVTPWGLVFAQLGLASLVYLIGCKRRFGRPLEEMPVERTNPLETAHALGGLFKAAQARALGARMIQQHLNAYVSSALGYRVDLMDSETRERLAGPLRIEKTDLDSYAKAAQAATSAQPLTDAELIQFGQKATAISRSFHHGAARGRRANAAG